eukprot:TRINITY_DN21106_c0_g1_i1.p4 TRINITY_DN21106_c0_g1~~TRINITY_DN21106_c0_g1_i1.p4  ORF type:complete len:208 (+),score=82.72 TRINITY_DN21106_c0_g1_i1:1794-2417(+)
MGCAWALQTSQKHCVATPGYRAPEVAAGKEWGAGVDLYALGVTLLEALTEVGQSSLSRLRVEALVRAAAGPREFAWGSHFMKTVVDGMLRADPAQRPTARELLSAPRYRPFFGAERTEVAGALQRAAEAARGEVLDADWDLILAAGRLVHPARYAVSPQQLPAVLCADNRMLQRRSARLESALLAAADVDRRAAEEAELARRARRDA